MTKKISKSGADVAEPAPVNKSKHLQVHEIPGLTTRDRMMAEVVAQGLAANAVTVVDYAKPGFGELSLTDMVAGLKEQGRRVNENDMSGVEQLLMAQAVTLNTMFGELSRRASLNMGSYLDAAERYLRLALKAQSQCRTTLETLATIKNPPVVFAKQANISNGPQQVNNGVVSGPAAAEPRARSDEATPQTKLLQGTENGSTTLDAGTTGAATGGHSTLEAVGAVQRPAKRGR